MNPNADSTDDPRHLMLLDALGEATPEQRARLADALRDDPALAAEHAAMCRVASRLYEPPPAALSPMPSNLATRLDALHTPPANNVIAFPTFRRFAPLAAAAAVAMIAAGAWVALHPAREGSTLAMDSSPNGAPRADSSAGRAAAQPAATHGDANPTAASDATRGVRRALLIGVEYSGSDTPKAQKTRDFDVNRMAGLLTGTFHFPEENIQRLLGAAATTKAIVAAFEKHLIAETKPGDVVVFVFTGHGTQVADLNGDEPDGLDEAFCTFDSEWSEPNTWLTDDILASLIARLSTDRVLVINTACHSGTSTRGASDLESVRIDGINSGFQPRPNAAADNGWDSLPRGDSNPERRPVLLAGCAAAEVGYRSDVPPVGSMFLSALLPELKKGGTRLTFRDAIQRITPQLVKNGRESARANNLPDKPQTPQAEGPAHHRIDDFLTPPPMPREPATPPTPPAPPPPAPAPIWQQATGDIALALATDKLTYTEGDLIEITITADRDCHLRLFYLGADHQTYQIFPNQHQPDAAVKKGQPVRLGGAGGAFKLRAKAPFGNEILMAVASSRPFTDEASFRFESDLVKEFQNTNLEALGHRGIGVEAADAPLVGRAVRLYRVEAKK